MLRLTLKILLLALCCAEAAYAGNPAPLFDRPVKLDQSGRPLYNSWELQEIQRRERKKRHQRDWRRRNSEQESPAQNEVTPPPSSTPATRAAGTSAIQGNSGYVPAGKAE